MSEEATAQAFDAATEDVDTLKTPAYNLGNLEHIMTVNNNKKEINGGSTNNYNHDGSPPKGSSKNCIIDVSNIYTKGYMAIMEMGTISATKNGCHYQCCRNTHIASS